MEVAHLFVHQIVQTVAVLLNVWHVKVDTESIMALLLEMELLAMELLVMELLVMELLVMGLLVMELAISVHQFVHQIAQIVLVLLIVHNVNLNSI